jgi:predicted GIY-YIG superfamily endonuclease
MAYGDLDLAKWMPLLSKERLNVMYMLRLCNEKIYVGSTTNFLSRMKEHTDQLGRGARMTRKNIPVEVARIECFKTYLEAHHREMQIKEWSKAKKEALIAQDIPELSSLAVPYWRKFRDKDLDENHSDPCRILVEDPE